MKNVVGHRASVEGQLCYELYVQSCVLLEEHFYPNTTEKPNTVHVYTYKTQHKPPMSALSHPGLLTENYVVYLMTNSTTVAIYM